MPTAHGTGASVLIQLVCMEALNSVNDEASQCHFVVIRVYGRFVERTTVEVRTRLFRQLETGKCNPCLGRLGRVGIAAWLAVQ